LTTSTSGTRSVDPPVDARETGGDLVDGAVQVVDPGLQRDGEVDEVAPVAAEQHALRRPQRAHSPPDEHQGREKHDGQRAGGDGDG
jgi:hypothetical protein